METVETYSNEFKEVCAFYGAAMHMAQVLEHGIVNALFFLDFIPRKKSDWTDIEFENFFDEQFTKTFGKFVHSLKKITVVPEAFIASPIGAVFDGEQFGCQHESPKQLPCQQLDRDLFPDSKTGTDQARNLHHVARCL